MHQGLLNILSCPNCHARPADGLHIEKMTCRRCNRSFFELNGMPCWFPSGENQRLLWNDLLAKFIEECERTREVHAAEMSGPDLTPTTRQRLSNMHAVRVSSQDAVRSILTKAGLTPDKRPQFAQFLPMGFVQYFELMLRDWGWHGLNVDSSYRPYQDENQIALGHVTALIDSHIQRPLKKMLVLGSGAGRLSWDLHCALRPTLTIALDNNPLLAYLSKLIIQDREPITLHEARKFPHRELPELHAWPLASPVAPEDAQRGDWIAFAADAWAMPFAEQSFDLVVTPWFMDISGRDCKDLIATIERVLEPDGYWLNYGPFLYPDELPESRKYTSAEIRELLALARFDVLGDQHYSTPYTHSPLNQRGRSEEVWAFLAQSAPDRAHLQWAEPCSETLYRDNPPAWLVMPHLPVPQLTQPGLFPAGLDTIVKLIDGKRSINDLAALLAPKIPDGHDPYDFLYRLFNEYVLKETPPDSP